MPLARRIRSTSTGGGGLATVYGIVKENEGFIWADCAPVAGRPFPICVLRLTETSAA